jgi:signal transduction histidine kinase/ligand-binding sensor domain-containing protein
VVGIAPAADGYLWVATPRHLSRFDGVRFEPFTEQDLAGYDKRIRALVPSRRGGLWFSTDHGPVVHLGRDGAQAFSDGLPQVQAEMLVEDGEGSVWLSYRGGLVYRLKGGRARAFGRADGVPEGPGVLAADEAGRVWFFWSGHLGIVEGERFHTLAVRADEVPRLAAARGGGVWLAAGLALYRCDMEGHVERRASLPPEHARSRVSALLEDKNGAVWMGTTYSGLFHYDDAGLDHVPTSHSSITSLAEDAEGDVWVGTGGGGLDRVRARGIDVEGDFTSLPEERVQSIAEDGAGALWGATANGGLVVRAAGSWTPVPSYVPSEAGAVTTVATDGDTVFIGTRDSRLHRLRGGRRQTWGKADGLPMHDVCGLLVEAGGDVLVAGEKPDAVARLRGDAVQALDLPPRARRLRALARDAAGRLWLGGNAGTLLRVDADRLVDETPAGAPTSSAIRALHATDDGSLWIGYESEGLGRLKDGRFARFGPEQGLTSRTIGAIAADGRGWLWLATEEGVVKVRLTELDETARGRRVRVGPARGTIDRSVPSLSDGGCGAGPAVRARDGRLWIPMGSSVAIVDPRRQPDTALPPPVRITRAAVDGRSMGFYRGMMPARVQAPVVDLGEDAPRLRLPPDHRRLDIDYTALAFAAPENVRFRHRLEGLDDSWIDDTRRTVSYTRLPAGPYVFRVIACGSDGTWNDAGATLRIDVAPFLWQRWWFRLLALAAFATALAGVVRHTSLRRLRARLLAVERDAALDRERARIARDIHDDVGNRLTTISLLSGLTRRHQAEPASVARHAAEIEAAAREVTDSLDDIVWAVNPRHDSLPDLVSRIGRFAAELLGRAGIACRLRLPDDPPPRTVSAEVRHNLYLAFKEAVTNAVRHAQAREVEIAVTIVAETLKVQVRDDGRGFGAGEDAPGADGLRNMRRRMADIGGSVEIASAPGAGTRVFFTLPLPSGRASP